jgi:hypothetical protein
VIFQDRRGRLAVRFGAQRPSFACAEVALNAGLAIVTVTKDGIRIAGEGVVRQHDNTIAITS